MAQTLNNLADRLTIGDPLVRGRLTIYPLFFSRGKEGAGWEVMISSFNSRALR